MFRSLSLPLLAAAVVLLLLSCSSVLPKPKTKVAEDAKPDVGDVVQPVDWDKVGSTAKVGDLDITFVHFGNLLGEYTDSSGKMIGSLGRGELLLLNTSPTKNVRLSHWTGLALHDDLGNAYQYKPFRADAKLHPTFDFDSFYTARTPYEGNLPAGGQATVFIWFEFIAPKATEARVTIPGAALAAAGPLHLRVSLKPPPKPKLKENTRSRAELHNLLDDKTRDEVIAILGQPGHLTITSTGESLIYFRASHDPKTEKVDNHVMLYLPKSTGRVSKIVP